MSTGGFELAEWSPFMKLMKRILIFTSCLTIRNNLTSAVIISVSFEPVVAEALVRPRTVGDARGVGVAQRLVVALHCADVDGKANLATAAKVQLIANNILSESLFTFT